MQAGDQRRTVSSVCAAFQKAQNWVRRRHETALKLAEKAFAIKPKPCGKPVDVLCSSSKQRRKTGPAHVKTAGTQASRTVQMPRDVTSAATPCFGPCFRSERINAKGNSIEAREARSKRTVVAPIDTCGVMRAWVVQIDQGKTEIRGPRAEKAWSVQPHPDLCRCFSRDPAG